MGRNTRVRPHTGVKGSAAPDYGNAHASPVGAYRIRPVPSAMREERLGVSVPRKEHFDAAS